MSDLDRFVGDYEAPTVSVSPDSAEVVAEIFEGMRQSPTSVRMTVDEDGWVRSADPPPHFSLIDMQGDVRERMADGEWHRISFAWDGDRSRTWVDGVLVSDERSSDEDETP